MEISRRRLTKCLNCHKTIFHHSQQTFCDHVCKYSYAASHTDFSTGSMAVSRDSNYDFSNFRPTCFDSRSQVLVAHVLAALSLDSVRRALILMDMPSVIEGQISESKVISQSSRAQVADEDGKIDINLDHDDEIAILHNWTQMMCCQDYESSKFESITQMFYDTIGFTRHVIAKIFKEEELKQLFKGFEQHPEYRSSLSLLVVALDGYLKSLWSTNSNLIVDCFLDAAQADKQDDLADLAWSTTLDLIESWLSALHRIDLTALRLSNKQTDHMAIIGLPQYKTKRVEVYLDNWDLVKVNIIDEAAIGVEQLKVATLRKFIEDKVEPSKIPEEYWFAHLETTNRKHPILLSDNQSIRQLTGLTVCPVIRPKVVSATIMEDVQCNDKKEKPASQMKASQTKIDSDPRDCYLVEISFEGTRLLRACLPQTKMSELLESIVQSLVDYKLLNEEHFSAASALKFMYHSLQLQSNSSLNTFVSQRHATKPPVIKLEFIKPPLDFSHMNEDVQNFQLNPLQDRKTKELFFDYDLEDFFCLVQPPSVGQYLLKQECPLILVIDSAGMLDEGSARVFLRSLKFISRKKSSEKLNRLKVKSLILDYEGMKEVYINIKGLENLFPEEGVISMFSSTRDSIELCRESWPLRAVRQIVYERCDEQASFREC